MTLTYHWPISFSCTATGSVTVATPRKSVSGKTRFLHHGALLTRPSFWKSVPTPKNIAAPPPGTSTSAFFYQISTYSFSDPPTRQEKSVPLGLFVASTKGSADSCKGQCLGDLIQVVLYFFLRSCEYAKSNSHKWTTQFRLRDIQFHDTRVILPF